MPPLEKCGSPRLTHRDHNLSQRLALQRTMLWVANC